MDIQKLSPLLDDYYEACGLACAIFTKEGERLYEPELLRGAIRPEYYQYIIMDFTIQKRDMDHPLMLLLDSNSFVGIAQLEEDIFLSTTMVGPLARDRAELLIHCREIVCPEMLVRFCDFLVSLPPFTLRKFTRAFSLLVTLCTGRQITSDDLMMTNTAASDLPLEAAERELFQNREELRLHTDMNFEDGVCAAVEAGDTELVKARLSAPLHGAVGQMSRNPINQARYEFVTFTALVTRAAIRGGLAQEAAYSMSDVYCQQMDRMMNAASIQQLSYRMVLDFTGRVRELRSGHRYSPPVQKCIDHIARHLHETVRLADLSELCGLCTRSISARFKEEVGVSVADYIGSEKLKEAKFLLSSSNYSLLEISTILQFNSQSYFTKRFKESFGVTPQKYRESFGNKKLSS